MPLKGKIILQGVQSGVNNSTLIALQKYFPVQHTDTFSFQIWNFIHSTQWMYISTFLELFFTIVFTLAGVYIGKKIRSKAIVRINQTFDKIEKTLSSVNIVLEEISDDLAELIESISNDIVILVEGMDNREIKNEEI